MSKPQAQPFGSVLVSNTESIGLPSSSQTWPWKQRTYFETKVTRKLYSYNTNKNSSNNDSKTNDIDTDTDDGNDKTNNNDSNNDNSNHIPT